MVLFKILLTITAAITIVATLVPLVKAQAWWIRIFDFPRLQILLLAIPTIVAYLLLHPFKNVPELFFLVPLLGITIYQLIRLLPYTFLFSKEVLDSKLSKEEERKLKIFFTNVLMTNRNSAKCIEMIHQCNPDIILAVETDKWWEKELSHLESEYPYKLSAPLANTYGILLLSRLELIDPEIKFLLDHNIPSLHTYVRLKDGTRLKLFGVHPKPPAPQESKSTEHRDGELIIVAKESKQLQCPVIVMGDLNDVAWSYTTRLFQKVSGLHDPRVGRGLFSTYHAENIFFRWPLDHIFISHHFTLVDIKRLPAFGSDHFPMSITLSYEPETSNGKNIKHPDKSDIQEANEKITNAHKKKN